MIELNYKKYGEQGENLVILHGLFGMLDNWHTLATQFAENYTVWAIDQRNHGKSPHLPGFDYKILSADLKHFFESHNMENAHVIGHSMGGKTAMQFALDNPGKILKLIIADIAPRAYDASHDEIIDALQSVDLSQVTKRQDADKMLAEKIPNTAVRQFLLKNLTREGEAYKWKMNLPALVENYETIIGAIDESGIYNGQVLFLSGERSDYITEADKPQILKQFPNAEFATIAGAGHWLHAEAPEDFKQTVLDFLAK